MSAAGKDATVKAVEKAHSERNCGNCGKKSCEFPKQLFLPALVSMGVKCNEWITSEAT